jgi:hypothetical protein
VKSNRPAMTPAYPPSWFTGRMASLTNFRAIDRETGFLLPPSIDDWPPEQHLARFVDAFGLIGIGKTPYRD